MKRIPAFGRAAMLAAAALILAAGAARAAFDDIEVSPRALALGGAWTALTADGFAPFHNPSALAWADATEAHASYVRPFGFDFVSQSAIAASTALPGRLGGVGIGVRHTGVEWLGERLTGETTVAFAHAFHLLRDRQSELAVGWAVNVYALDYGASVTGLDPGSATSVGITVGATARVRDRTRVGFQALNLNQPNIGDRDKQDLTRCVTVGLAYAPYPGVQTVLDLCNQLGETVRYRGGAEFEVADFLWLRAGVRTEPQAFTAGLGLRHRGVHFDYGFSTGGVLGETHQLGLGVALPAAR